MSQSVESRLPSWFKKPAFWSAVIFAFALGMRLIGIDWGMPNDQRHQSVHPDEPWNWVVTQQINPGQGDFAPTFYNYGTLYLTVVRIAGLVVPDQTFQDPIDPMRNWKQARQDTAVGRLISAMAGAATAWLVFLILLARTSLFGAIAGGLILASSPGHLIHSRYMSVDVFAGFLAIVSLYFALRLIPNRGEPPPEPMRKLAGVPVEILLAGLFAGLTMGTKYSGVLVFAAIPFALAFRPKEERFMGFALASLATILAFVIATPGVLVEPAIFRRDFLYEIAHTSEGHGLVFVATAPGWLYHVANLMEGLSIGLVLIGLAGFAAACSKKHVWAIAVTTFLILTYVLIARAEVKFFRYVIPLLPLFAISAGWLVGQAHRNPDRRWRFLVGFAILVWGGMTGKGLAQSLFMAGPDPRDEAADWLRDKANQSPITVGIVSDAWFQTPALYQTTALPRAVPFAVRERTRLAYEAQDPSLRVLQSIPANPNERFDWDVRLLDQKPDYVTASSFEVEDYHRIELFQKRKEGPLDPVVELKLSRYQAFLKRLTAEYDLARMFGEGGPSIHDLMYIRPKVWIWKRKTPSTPKSTPSSTTSGSSEAPASTP